MAPDRARATWQDVDKQIFEGRTTTSRPRALPWPWCEAVREDFVPRARGFWPWNDIRKRITAFRNRVQGPYLGVMSLQRGRWSSMEDFMAAGGMLGLVPPVHVDDELPVLCEWLAARKIMASRIESVEVVPALTTALSPGSWVRTNMVPPRTMTTSRGPYNQVAYHGTSMNNLNRVIVHGLQEGWSCVNEGRADAIPGIYLMGEIALDLCVTYALYTPLQDTGYYYAPYLQVRYAYDGELEWRRHVAKREGRASQYVTYPDVSFVSAIYFHVVAGADLVYGPEQQWLSMEVERPANMEIPIGVDHALLVTRSHRRYLEAKAAGMAPEEEVDD